MMMGLVQAISASPGKGGLPPIEVQPHERTDRSSSSIPLSQSMTMADHPIIVQPGFKTRPLRDGGGKPSPGRRPPPVRSTFKAGGPCSVMCSGCPTIHQQKGPAPSLQRRPPDADMGGHAQRQSTSPSRRRKLWKRISHSTYC